MLFSPTIPMAFLNCLVALRIPLIVGGAASMLAVLSDADQFDRYSHYSTYLSRCCWSSVIGLPSLFPTDCSASLYFPPSFFTVSNSFFMFPSLTACFTAIVRSLCISAYRFRYSSPPVCLLLYIRSESYFHCIHSAVFNCYFLDPPWILPSVLIEIHCMLWCFFGPITS